MQKQFVEATNQRGDAIGGAQVYIYAAGTARSVNGTWTGTLLPIFTDKLGGTPKPNPFTLPPDGEDYFYVANVRYDRVISVSNYNADVATDIIAYDPGDGGPAGGPDNTDGLPEGTSNLYLTSARVRGTDLSGISTADATAITTTDTIVAGLGKAQAQINQRPFINTPVSLSAATNLTVATHGNRQIIFSGANANLTVQSDGSGGWGADDEVQVMTDEGSSGVPTLVFPDASTLIGARDVVVGAVRKAANVWQKYMLPAGVFAAGFRGLVPAASGSPSSSKFLTETGAWAVPAGVVGSGKFTFLERSLLILPLSGGNSFASMGTSTSPLDSSGAPVATMDGSSFVKSLQRVRYGGQAAAISRMAGIWTNGLTPLLTPSASITGRGGFTARVVGSVGDAITNGQFGIGFCQNVPVFVVGTEPSAMLNVIGVIADSGDAHMQFAYNDGSGACTKVDLGANFPSNTNQADPVSLTVTFNATGATRSIDYTVANLNNGATATGNVNTNLPVEGILLNPFLARGSANNASQPFIDIHGVASGAFLL